MPAHVRRARAGVRRGRARARRGGGAREADRDRRDRRRELRARPLRRRPLPRCDVRLRRARAHARASLAPRRRCVAVGEPYWRTWPLPPAAPATNEEEWLPLAATVARAESTGVRVVSLIASSEDDWDRYESLHWQTLDRWLAANPEHPQAEEFRARGAAYRDALPALGACGAGLGDLRLPHVITPARRAAYEVLLRVFEHDAYADRAFRSAAEGLDERERAFAQRLAYGSVQRVRTLDHAIETLGRRPVRKLDPPVRAALRLGAYQLGYTDTAPHAAVNESVELVRRARLERAVPFTNAVMRRLDRGDPARCSTGFPTAR